ncbi:MAG: glycoside hydrolase family 3 protein [Bergeyella sp.]|nr:glycoside hydrolase family 3 protein [Bergeyella sp.]
MKFYISFIFTLFSFVLLFSQYTPKGTTKYEKRKAKKFINKMYRSLSLDEKIGQLFLVALYTNKGEKGIDKVRKMIIEEKIGGIILMQEDADREKQLIEEFQKKSPISLFVGIDAEWGLQQRLKNTYKLPWALALGAIQDKKLIYRMAQNLARDAKLLGINWIFAPVADVNTNPLNPIIGNRSFGSDVKNVSCSALSYAKGLQDEGVLATLKHFPGHGDTQTDSHLDLPTLKHSLQRLDSTELAPFRMLSDKGIASIMVAHLNIPSLDKKALSSISKKIITGLLKNKMNYKGIIVTDALDMAAVAKRYKPGVLEDLAFRAGNDIMLFSQDVAEGKRLIKNGIKNGEIPEKRLKESVKKILLTKYYLGLLDRNKNNKQQHLRRDTSLVSRKGKINENIIKKLLSPEHKELVQKLYAHSLTLIKNKESVLPLKRKKTYYYLPLEEGSFASFYEELKKSHHINLISSSQASSLPPKSCIIVGIHKDNSTAYTPYKISDASKEIIKKLAKNHTIILNVFASPYALCDFPIENIKSVLVAYENNEDAQISAGKNIKGEHSVTGKLPVDINEDLRYGMGIDLVVVANKE